MTYERMEAIVMVRGRPSERMLEGVISMQNHFFCDAKLDSSTSVLKVGSNQTGYYGMKISAAMAQP